MTADIKLLPLPEGVDVIFSPDGNGAALDVFTAEQVQDISRANVAHATAAKDAEIEALREALRQAHKDYGCELRDPNGTIWEYAARQKEQADRLAEALRMMVENADDLVAYRHDEDDVGDRPCCQVASYEPHADHCPTHIARAALRDHDKGARNG